MPARRSHSRAPRVDVEPCRSREFGDGCLAVCRPLGLRGRSTGAKERALTAHGLNIWAVIPVKETTGAKQRLADAVPAHLRGELVLTMLEDVLMAISPISGIAGLALVTLDPRAPHA